MDPGTIVSSRRPSFSSTATNNPLNSSFALSLFDPCLQTSSSFECRSLSKNPNSFSRSSLEEPGHKFAKYLKACSFSSSKSILFIEVDLWLFLPVTSLLSSSSKVGSSSAIKTSSAKISASSNDSHTWLDGIVALSTALLRDRSHSSIMPDMRGFWKRPVGRSSSVPFASRARAIFSGWAPFAAAAAAAPPCCSESSPVRLYSQGNPSAQPLTHTARFIWNCLCMAPFSLAMLWAAEESIP
mmetsp:Transcript_32271/g.96793  ORF Transcript_32271/g.96793 Transcript_32271/m.96793 type:complete len:241 (-) Transcript_32271:2271-2993(-)